MTDRLSVLLNALKTRLSGWISSRQQDYELPVRSLVLSGLKYILCTLCISFLFYDDLLYSVGLIIFLPLYLKKCLQKYREAEKMKLRTGFSETIRYMSSALETGYSAENAIKEAYREMRLSYDSGEQIVRQLELVIRRIENNVPLESTVLTMASETQVPEISEFAEILATAKRTGGDLMAVIRHTSGVLERRAELSRNIRMAIAEKKFEADIMKLVPAGILLYLRIASPGFLDSVYGNLKGVIFMSLMLALYGCFAIMAGKMTEI